MSSAPRINPNDRRPLLLIDIDGVLNALSHTLRRRVMRGHRAPWQMHTLAGYQVLLNPEHGVALNELRSHFELVWATSWEHQANELVGPLLGLPALPVITFGFGDSSETHPDPEYSGGASYMGWRTYKVPWVDAACRGRALAWLDDDFAVDAVRWAKRRNVEDAPTKLIEIDPIHGLKPEHLAEGLAWAESLEVESR